MTVTLVSTATATPALILMSVQISWTIVILMQTVLILRVRSIALAGLVSPVMESTVPTLMNVLTVRMFAR